MNARSGRNLLALLALTAAASAAPLAMAQTAAATANKDDTAINLDKIVVTGSYIPAALDEAKAMPVQVIDAKGIEITGVKTNVLDLLRKMVPQIQGANNIGTENANISGGSTNGGSSVALRNIDTLVLIDGKRVVASAVAAGGASGGATEFVDLNLVPISAVDRIEVLTDGASAIYGTDAVSGVINIIMRKDYQGAGLDFHFTAAPKDTGGNWTQKSVAVVAGANDAKTHLTFSAEWSQNDPLWQRETSYDNPYYGTASYPGVINDAAGKFYRLKEGLNAPPVGPNSIADLVAAGIYVPTADPTTGFNLALKPTILNKVDKRIATLAGSHSITDNLTLSGSFLYGTTETNYQLNPQPVTKGSTALISAGQSAITDTGATIRNRFIFGPNRIYDNKTNFYRLVAELSGKVNDYFNWSVSGNYSNSYQVALGQNQILDSALQSAITTGKINLFAIQQDPAKLQAANIFGTSVAIYDSTLYTLDAQANGKIWDLPAGGLYYAAGLEYRNQSLVATADMNSIIPPGSTTSLWNNGTSLSPFDKSRDVTAQFAEIKIPAFSPAMGIPGLHLLNFDIAVRHEKYSEGNETTVPKYSLRYLPFNDELAIRATYAESFTAPTLYALYGPSSSGFTNSPGGLNAYNTAGQPTGAKFPNIQGQQINGFNPHLTPSTAKSYTAGFVYSPKWAKGLEVTLDYYDIKQEDLIGSPGGTLTMMQDVEKLGAASVFSQYVTLGNYAFNGGTHVTTPGQLSPNPSNVYVIQQIVNIAAQQQHGFDLDVRYTLPNKDYGRFVFESKWAFLQEFLLQSSPDDPGTDYAGYDDYGTLPKSRAYTTVDWDNKGYGATLGWTFINSVDNLSGDHMPSYNTFDIQFRMDLGQVTPKLKGLAFDIGCNNFTDKGPVLDRTNYASPPFDASAYSFFGRMYYADLHYKF